MANDDTGPSEASDIRNLLLHAQLDATLHEADALMAAVAALESKIDRLNIAGSQALVQLEQAHQACHQGSLAATLEYIAQAMEILASDV